MDSSDAFSKKQLVLLYLAATVPVIALFVVYFFTSIGLLKLAAIGLTLGIFGFLLFAFPKLGFYLLIFYVYSGLSFYFEQRVPYLIVFIVFVAVLLRLFTGEVLELRNRMFNWSVVFFSLIALTSFLYAYSPELSLLHFAKFLKVLMLTFLALQLLKTPADLQKFVFVVFLGSIMSIMLGLANLKLGIARDVSFIGISQVMRFEGTQVRPNRLAGFLVSALPLGFYAIKCARHSVYRVLSVAGVFLIAFAILATYTRAAFIPLVFVLLATLFREVKSKKVYMGILGLVMVSLLLTPSFYWARISSIGEVVASIPRDWSIYMRLAAAKAAIKLISQYPLTGVGLGNFILRSEPSLVLRIVTHNAYLEILVGVGIFGFIAFMGMFLSGIRDCLRGMRARWELQSEWMRSLSFYVLLSILAAMIKSLFLSSEFLYFLWIPLAGGLVVGNLVRRQLAGR